MQPAGQGVPTAETYALAAAMAAAAAANQNSGGNASASLPIDPSQLLSAAMLAAAPQHALRPQQAVLPRLGAGGGSAFAQYKPPPRPQLCAPPIHGPPQPSVTLGPGIIAPQPLRPTISQLPGSVAGVLPSGGLPAGTPMPSTVQGLAEMLQAVAAAQQMQAAAATSGAVQSMPAAVPAALATASDVAQEAAAAPPPAVVAPSPAVSSAKGSGGAVTEKLKASRTRYQEKNRRAQARFRERQKVKQNETSQRMADLEAQRAALTVERDQLSIRAATLQQCLAQRQAASGAAAEDDKGASSRADGQDSHSSVSHVSSGSSSEASQPKSQQHHVSGGDGSGAEVAADAAAGKPQRDLPQSWDDFARWYEGIIQEMAPLLAPAQTGNEPEALARVEALWSEVNDVLGRCFASNEGVRTRAHTGACLPEGAAAVPPPTAELWAKVTAALQLTEEQVAAMIEARREFLASLKALLQQRRALNAIIQASVIKDLDSNPAVSVQHNKCLEVVHLLERNTWEQCRLNTKLGLQLWDRLMTPLQGATACVGMYPFVPDKLAILTAVAMRAGEPDAATLLGGDPLPSKQPDSSPAANGGTTTDGSSAMGSGSE